LALAYSTQNTILHENVGACQNVSYPKCRRMPKCQLLENVGACQNVSYLKMSAHGKMSATQNVGAWQNVSYSKCRRSRNILSSKANAPT
jgi:hypothetical protein